MNMNCNYNSNFNKKKAFTLIELLIVIAIIGILFIVLVSKVDFATDKAKASGVQTDFRSFQVALEMVSKENAGFNTFGWDTGDNAGAAPAGYTYTNATKDAGDRIRNAYDEGDTNLNGQYDDDETWTGRKIYTETWTGCYTLINPGDASDMSAIFDLETAINKNLDPKLHIAIADDGTISMANGLKDPWSTQYHGRYITNASTDAAAKWNTDASMAGSAGDNMDRGAILMYSNGANQKFGTKVKIVGGVVTATVSQIDANTPDNNKMGADDYVLAVVYTYTNGYGETASITEGFSNDQEFLTGNGGNVSNMKNPDYVGTAYIMLNKTDYDLGSPLRKAIFRVDADQSKLVDVKVDNVLVDKSNYTVTSGSTIVTFIQSYMETLSVGNHQLTMIFDDGYSTTNFVIDGIICEHDDAGYGGYEFWKGVHALTFYCSQCNQTYAKEVMDCNFKDGVCQTGCHHLNIATYYYLNNPSDIKHQVQVECADCTWTVYEQCSEEYCIYNEAGYCTKCTGCNHNSSTTIYHPWVNYENKYMHTKDVICNICQRMLTWSEDEECTFDSNGECTICDNVLPTEP